LAQHGFDLLLQPGRGSITPDASVSVLPQNLPSLFSWLSLVDIAIGEVNKMVTAKLFASGRSQAVQLPEAFRLEGGEVMVKRFGNGVLLLPAKDVHGVLVEALEEFEPEFKLERDQPVKK
jgi:antitoxin VapB